MPALFRFLLPEPSFAIGKINTSIVIYLYAFKLFNVIYLRISLFRREVFNTHFLSLPI